MWKRNLLFWGVCLAGCGYLAGGLLRDERVQPPELLPVLAETSAEIAEVASRIDQEFEARWAKLGLRPAAPADNQLVIRRLSLSMTGATPALEELRAWESAPPDEQINWWLARLLEDDRFAYYTAERLARMYVGAVDGPFLLFRRNRFVHWLGEQLKENRPYNEIVTAMIAGRGVWTSDPEVNFITVTLDQNNDNAPDPIRLAGRTSRAFLGMRIDCLQCHDDQLDSVQLGDSEHSRMGLQTDFHQLAAFFSEPRVSFRGVQDQQSPYMYQYLGKETETEVAPVPPFLPELMPTDGARREKLAAWVTHPRNRPFARTAVNRIWAILFGRPLVEPIDDIPLFGEYPPGLETLADDFIAHDFDIRRLIQVITATRIFRMDSRADWELTQQHHDHWAVFPLSRLRPEQVSGAVIQAASLKTMDSNRHILFQLIGMAERNDFVERYGDTGEDEFDELRGYDSSATAHDERETRQGEDATTAPEQRRVQVGAAGAIRSGRRGIGLPLHLDSTADASRTGAFRRSPGRNRGRRQASGDGGLVLGLNEQHRISLEPLSLVLGSCHRLLGTPT